MSKTYFRDINIKHELLVSNAKTRLIIVCPFIKKRALISVLEKLDANVKVTVVVRWRLSDLVLGASEKIKRSLLDDISFNCKDSMVCCVCQGRL